MRGRFGRFLMRGFAALVTLGFATSDRAAASPALTYAVTDMGLIRGPYGPLTGPDYIISDEALVYHGFESWPRHPDADVYPTLPLTRPEDAGRPTPWMGDGVSYDYIARAYTNTDGSVVAYTERYGLNKQRNTETNLGFVVKKDADGEWVKVLDLGSHNRGADGPGLGPSLGGVNDRNQVFAITPHFGSAGSADPRLPADGGFLYDVDSDTIIDLAGILVENWTKVGIVSLDRSGRILVSGTPVDGDGRAHYLMLSPTDLEPIIPTPVPEPGALAVFACAAAGFIVRRHRRRSA